MMRATYSPDDNKLRLYSDVRLDPETYARVRAAGFIWAPKQALFVAPMWTPGREDLLIDLCGAIEDEDTGLVARAEERAERFEDYGEKRAEDAERAREAVSAVADNIPFAQPILVGHHSERHARKDAERIEAGMRRAIRLWDTSQYWKDRAAGAIRHAKYKERPDVRARRIKGLEADKRKQERTKAEAEKLLNLWQGVTDPTKLTRTDGKPTTTEERAKFIANHDHGHHCFPVSEYLRREGQSTYEGAMSLWSALEDGIITGEQAAALAIPGKLRTIASAERWISHYDNRLAYERAMLAEDGGTVADKKGPEKGGACKCWASPRGGWSIIQKVNRVSVTVLDNWGNGGRDFTRTIPFDKLGAIMTKAEVDRAREEGRLIGECSRGFGLADSLPEPAAPASMAESETDEAGDPETALRALWDKQGVPKERQDELIREVAEKAKPGAHVGPFTIPTTDQEAGFEALRETLKSGVEVVIAPQLFPTPAEFAARMVDMADIRDGMNVLEPSAGKGNLIDAVRRKMAEREAGRCAITAVEIVPSLAEYLRRILSLPADRVFCADFLSCNGELGKFERIIINPPFESGADIKHIQHARTMLTPGGRLVALCANGPRQREALMDVAEHWEDLPEGSFKDQGTNVNVALLVLTCDDRSQGESTLTAVSADRLF